MPFGFLKNRSNVYISSISAVSISIEFVYQIESILFQVPVPVEFNQKDEFKEKCSLDLIQIYPNSEIMIEFRSQMSMR